MLIVKIVKLFWEKRLKLVNMVKHVAKVPIKVIEKHIQVVILLYSLFTIL